MEENKVVKYYSYIDRKWLYVEVNYETYKYFDRLKKQRKEKRKSRQRRFEESNYCYDPGGWFPESLYCEDKNINVARQIEDKEFSKIIWDVVANLEGWQKNIIADYYIYGYDFVEIAEKYDKSKSGISQIFDTIYHHLRILFVSDQDFQKTDYAINRKQDYLQELKDYFNEVKGGVAQGIFTLSAGEAMENIVSFAKKLKQEIKISYKLKTTH